MVVAGTRTHSSRERGSGNQLEGLELASRRRRERLLPRLPWHPPTEQAASYSLNKVVVVVALL